MDVVLKCMTAFYVCISLPFIDSYLSDTKFALEFWIITSSNQSKKAVSPEFQEDGSQPKVGRDPFMI